MIYKITLLYLLCIFSFNTIAAQDGVSDPTFNAGGIGANGAILTSVPQPDGKILIGGSFTAYNGISSNRIMRLEADGTPDPAFITGTGADGDIKHIIVQPDGKIIIAGMFSSYNDVAANNFARLNADGTLDTTFSSGSGLTVAYDIYSIALQSDGKLLVAGWFNVYNGISIVFHNLFRLNQDGSLDMVFDSPVSGNVWPSVYKVLVQPDGKIIYGVDTGPDNIDTIHRINPDGTQDDTFTPVSFSLVRQVTDLLLLPDGKIMVSGHYDNAINIYAGNRLARLNADGTIDETFSEGTGTAPEYYPVRKMAVQSNGKLIIAGSFDIYDGYERYGLARLNDDGSVDESFDSVEGTKEAAVRDINALFIQPGESEKIIIAGAFDVYNGKDNMGLARVIADGTLLDTNVFIKEDNDVIVCKNNGQLLVQSVKNIEEVEVFDVAGRLICQKRNINDVDASLDGVTAADILIVRVKCVDGTRVIKKIY